VPNRANRYHVEFTLKKFLLPKVVAMFCQRQLLTEVMLQNGMPADFYSEHPDEVPSLDNSQKDIFLKAVNAALADVDKLWPMSPSIDEVDDDRQQCPDAAPHSASGHTSSPPPVNNAFQVYGRISVHAPQQHDGSSTAVLGAQPLELGKDALKPVWIRPWDSVFDRKKNGFGTFFAKEVLELCHCDAATIGRILGISMRHIAVKKSEMVLPPVFSFSLIPLTSFILRFSKSRSMQRWLLASQLQALPYPTSNVIATQPWHTRIYIAHRPPKHPHTCTLSQPILEVLVAYRYLSNSTKPRRRLLGSQLHAWPTSS
jgi:hypothetical protein